MSDGGTDYELNATGNFAQKMIEAAKAISQMNAETKKAAENSRAAEKDATKWLSAIQTPLEKYNKTLERLNELQKQNKLSEEERAKAAKVAFTQYEKQTSVNAGLGQTSSLTDQITSALGRQALQWGSVAGAIGIARAALQAYSALGKEFEGNKQSSDVALGRLQQIAGSSGQFGQYKAMGESFAAASSTSVGEGYRTVNALANIDATDSADFIARLRNSEFIGEFGSTLAPGVKSVQSNVAGAGDLKRVLATALGAAGKNSLDLESTLGYMSVVGSAAKPYGMSLEEVAALTSAGQTGAGRGEAGATAVASFLDETRAKGIFKPGMSVPELVAANRGTAYGTNAAKGFNALSDAGAQNYAQALAEAKVGSASPESYVLSRAGLAAASDGGFAARQAQRRATVELEMAQDPYTANEARTQAGIARGRIKFAPGTFGATGASIAGNVASQFPVSESVAETATIAGGYHGSYIGNLGPAAQILQAMYGLMRRQRPQAPPQASANP